MLSITALFLSRDGRGRAVIAGLCGVAFLLGTGISIYQVGVEQHWWVSGCTGQLAADISLSDMRAQLLKKPPKACDDDVWTVFGFSMATYNIFYSLALAMGTFAASRMLWRKS